MKSNYIDNAVLKLRRRYGKDELVAHLEKELKEAKLEIGYLKSEIAEYEDAVEKRAKEMFDNKFKQSLGDKYAARVKHIKAENKALNKKIKKLIEEKHELIYKYVIKPSITNNQ